MLLSLPDEYNEIKIAFICAIWISLMSLPAIWAALSNKHWFFRFAAVLIGALLVLAMRAYDLTVVYFFYSVVVIVTLALAKRFRRRRAEGLPQLSLSWPFSSFQYSLKDLFLLVLLSGVLAAIVAALMKGDFYWEWTTVNSAALGMSALVCSLVWLRFGKWRLAIRAVVFLAVWAAVCFFWNMKDDSGLYLVLSSNYFYFDDRLSVIFDQFDILPDFLKLSSLLFSLGYGLLVVAFFLLWILAGSVTQADENSAIGSAKRWAARICLVLLFLCLTPDAGIVYWRLVKPLPAIAAEPLPNPNGYDFLVKAGQKLEGVKIPGDGPYTASGIPDPPAAFASFVKTHATALDEVHIGFAMPIQTPIPSSLGEFGGSSENWLHLRQLARGLEAKSINAAQEKRFKAAVDSALDCVELGIKTPRGGLMVDMLVGVAITGTGTNSLKEVRENLDVHECREIIHALIELESHREPLEAMFHRDSLWEQKFNPWEMRLETAVQTAPFKKPSTKHELAVIEARHRQDVAIELLKTELALRAFKLETGDYPQQLIQLVPKYLPSVPLDPYSRDSQPLIYRLQDDGKFLIYSVWHDGKDSGGVRGTMRDFFSGEPYDYFLDQLPDPPPVATPQTGQPPVEPQP